MTLHTIYTGLGAVDTVSVTFTVDQDIHLDTVELSVGHYATSSGAWLTPSAVSFSADGLTCTASIIVGNGHVNPVAGKYWLWYRVTAPPLTKIQPVRATPFKVTDAAGDPIGTQGPFVKTVNSVAPDSAGNVVVSGGGGGSVLSVTAGDATVTVGGTATDPTVKVTPGTFDASGAAATAQAAAVAAAATDATTKANAAQAAATSAASSDATTKANAAQAAAIAAAATDATSKVATEATARTAAIATQHTADVAAFDASGAASTAQTAAIAAAASDATTKANAAQAAAQGSSLQKASNLSDLASAATAKTNLGLGNVDNTSDVNKPVSTAQQTALNLKAPTARTITAGTGLTGGGDLSANRTLAVVGVAGGLFNVTDATYGATGNGATDDTTAIQAAITAAQAVNGTVYIPRGLYKLTSALSITASCRIIGEGCLPLFGSVDTDFNTINNPVAAPYLSGAVLLPSTAGQNCITITGRGVSVDMRDFGIRFADAIKFTNTGHGIYYVPPARSGQTYLDNGLIGAHWSRLTVFGHDGNHYAYYLTNPIYNTFEHLRAFGGGVLFMENNGAASGNTQFYGNMQVDHLYGQVFLAGTADGIRLKNTLSQLNLLLFNRPQITCAPQTTTFAGTTGPSNVSGQRMFNADQFVKRLTIIAPDFETNSNCTCAFPLATAAQFIAPGLINFGPGNPNYDALKNETGLTLSQDFVSGSPSATGTRQIHSVSGVGASITVDNTNRKVSVASAVQTAAYATGSRPSAATMGAGSLIFDSTLGKPIWSNGTAWVDATGAVV